jgi:hypothetical protein
VLNNPVRNVDPSGHCFGVLGGIDILICAGVVVFVAGTIAAVASSPSSGFNWNDNNWSDWSLPGHLAEEQVPETGDKPDALPSLGSTGSSPAADGAQAGVTSAPRANPLQGNPGSTSTTYKPNGQVKQVRKYGADGYPEIDEDYDHDHGQGLPHEHPWTRPEDGSPPTHQNRGPGRPLPN